MEIEAITIYSSPKSTLGTKQRWRRWQQEQQKSNRFRSAKQQLFVRASRFLYIPLPSLHNYDVKLPNFTSYGRHEHETTTFPGLRLSPLEFKYRKICQKMTNWTRWNKRDEVWSRAISLFKWRFRSRRRCCYLSYLLTLTSHLGQKCGLEEAK